MSKARNICLIGIGIAMYFVLGIMIKIPIVGHLKTDLGYVAFGFWCYAMGPVAFLVGMIGCMLESLLIDGWIPIGWMAAQALIGIICGLVYKKNKNALICILFTLASVFIGIGLLKTSIECFLYGIPFSLKFAKNMTVIVPDSVAMVGGYFIWRRLNKTLSIKS